jgi:hypothetical protein
MKFVDDVRTGALTLEVPIYVDSDLLLGSSGELKLVSFVSSESEDALTEIEVPFDDLIDNLIDYYRFENGAKSLYKIAKELHLYASLIEGAAAHMNDDADVELDWPFESDAFDMTPPDYDELDR